MSKAVKASFEIYNDSKAEEICSVYCAAYSGGKMIGIERTQYTVAPHGRVAAECKIAQYGDAAEVKIFVWQSGCLMPLKIY